MRTRRGLTLEDMIEHGFSARHWQQVEKGRPITCTTLLRIAAALNIPLARLIKGLPRVVSISAQP